MLSLTAEQLKAIKRLTAFDLKDILEMKQDMFFFNITRLLARGKLNQEQHAFIVKLRVIHSSGGRQQTFDVITTFGGKTIG